MSGVKGTERVVGNEVREIVRNRSHKAFKLLL